MDSAGAHCTNIAGLRSNTLEPVLSLGDRESRTGWRLGFVIALCLHAWASAHALASLWEMERIARHMRDVLHEAFWAQYEVDLTPEGPIEPQAPAPLPPLAPIAEAKPAPRAQEDPYDTPPPAPAKAAKIITAPTTPEHVADLTDRGFVSGDSETATYGQVSAAGTGTAPTYAPNASHAGVPGGTGQAIAPSPPAPDLSRAPNLLGGTSWDCPFPPEADAEQIDQAVVTIVVAVKPDGSPQSVNVLSDPGHGFGRAARVCALSRRYQPGLDRTGAPMTVTTPPIRVRFTR